MTLEVTVTIEIPAPRTEVWDEIARLESHVEWMADARRIEFPSQQRRGIGTVMRVETRIGPFRTSDLMEVSAWEPPERMAVVHRGLFSGHGEFELVETVPGITRFTWREEISFPWYFGGSLGGLAARPLLRWVWRRNLRRFRSRF